jgi:serine protease Do
MGGRRTILKRHALLSVVIWGPVLLLLAACASTLSLNTLPNAVTQASTQTPRVSLPVTGGNPAPVAANSALAAFQGTLEEIYAQVNPSVVNIQVILNNNGANFVQPFHRNPFGQQGTQEALGSGFVWDNQGHIVTNNHVVAEATTITVTLANGSTYEAKLVGTDPNSDLAVIQVNAAADALRPVSMADSTQVRVGQLAIAIGNPFGLSGTMTEGIISALSRSLPVDSSGSSQNGTTYTIPDIIQTDAAINPGNSGGVLVNDRGQVIGVTAAIQSNVNANSGIGFVIPASIVQRVVPILIQTGTYQHPWLGISGTDLTLDLVTAMNLKPNQRGALVIDIEPSGPADRAGLRGSTKQTIISGQPALIGGDVITAIDGHSVNSYGDLTSYVFDNSQVGQTVTLTVLRQGSEKTVQLKLGVLPVQ